MKEEELKQIKEMMLEKYKHERDKVVNLRDYDSDNDEEISQNVFK